MNGRHLRTCHRPADRTTTLPSRAPPSEGQVVHQRGCAQYQTPRHVNETDAQAATVFERAIGRRAIPRPGKLEHRLARVGQYENAAAVADARESFRSDYETCAQRAAICEPASRPAFRTAPRPTRTQSGACSLAQRRACHLRYIQPQSPPRILREPSPWASAPAT